MKVALPPLRSLPNPPTLQVCECVVILRNLNDVSWGGDKAMMADGGFLRSLQEFDKDAVSEKQVKKVKDYMKVRDRRICSVRPHIYLPSRTRPTTLLELIIAAPRC